MNELSFLTKWARQLDAFMEFILVALVGGVLMACFSADVKIRYLVGSVIFGAGLGGAGQYYFTSDAAPIILTILGVLTAPVTIAKLSGMTIFQAIDEIKARHDNTKP